MFPRLALASLLLLPFGVQAADFNLDVKAEGIELGAPVLGPKLSPGDLKGHVVLLEFWGRNCAPCLTSLPHVTKLSEDYGAFGLVVIGAHAQEGTAEQIRDRARSRGVSFSVVERARVKDGNDFKGIPHCMLFDQNGKCLYRGSPNEIDAKVRDAVGRALAEKIDGTPTRTMKPLVDNLKKGQAPAPILQKAVSLSKMSEKDTANQAKSFVSKLTSLADKQLKDTENLRSEDPILMLPRLARLSADFKGTPPGTKAGELLKEMKKDKAVIGELTARPMLEKIRAVDSALQAVVKDGDPKAPEFQKSQSAVLKQLQAAIKQLKKTAAEAPSTKEALEIGEKYGLNVK